MVGVLAFLRVSSKVGKMGDKLKKTEEHLLRLLALRKQQSAADRVKARGGGGRRLASATAASSNREKATAGTAPGAGERCCGHGVHDVLDRYWCAEEETHIQIYLVCTKYLVHAKTLLKIGLIFMKVFSKENRVLLITVATLHTRWRLKYMGRKIFFVFLMVQG